MNEKPIIRHCRNCEWAKINFANSVTCEVTYKYFSSNGEQRRKALFCRYYKQKDIKIQDGI